MTLLTLNQPLNLRNPRSNLSLSFTLFNAKQLHDLAHFVPNYDHASGCFDPDGRNPLLPLVIGAGAVANFSFDYVQSWRASGKGFVDYWKSGEYSNWRGVGQATLGAATSLGGAAVGALEVGGLATTILSRSILSFGMGSASAYIENKAFNQNTSLFMGGIGGVAGLGIGSGLSRLFSSGVSPVITKPLGTFAYGMEGFAFKTNPWYGAGQTFSEGASTIGSKVFESFSTPKLDFNLQNIGK